MLSQPDLAFGWASLTEGRESRAPGARSRPPTPELTQSSPPGEREPDREGAQGYQEYPAGRDGEEFMEIRVVLPRECRVDALYRKVVGSEDDRPPKQGKEGGRQPDPP